MVQLRRFLIACVGVLGPFVLRPERLWHPGPWVLLLGALVMQLTLPMASAQDMAKAKADAGSAKLILLTSNLVVLVPVFEFVLRAAMVPAPFSAWVVVGAVVLLAGTALRVWAIRVLGAAFTGVVQTTEAQPLINRGPYRLLRHPSYTGVLVAFLGQSVMFESGWGAALTLGLMVPVYLYRIRHEERALRAHFGERYDVYRGKSWALLPWLF